VHALGPEAEPFQVLRERERTAGVDTQRLEGGEAAEHTPVVGVEDGHVGIDDPAAKDRDRQRPSRG
jgi:hypothetical protein